MIQNVLDLAVALDTGRASLHPTAIVSAINFGPPTLEAQQLECPFAKTE